MINPNIIYYTVTLFWTTPEQYEVGKYNHNDSHPVQVFFMKEQCEKAANDWAEKHNMEVEPCNKITVEVFRESLGNGKVFFTNVGTNSNHMVCGYQMAKNRKGKWYTKWDTLAKCNE